ncbi:MAG: TatD family hydrolase [Chthonomonas sp.]|nr:TatD family hydrolase [Chthonomonas sp.]
MRLFDTHCHLYTESALPDAAAAIHQASEAGVDRLTVIGIDLETTRQAIAMADRFPGVYATAGWHPNHAATFTPDVFRELQELARHPKVVAVGECGLDFHWDYATLEQQIHCLDVQLDWAESSGLPVVFHCREAVDALIQHLQKRNWTHACVWHCFSGNEAQAEVVLQMGSYLGVDGPVTFPKSELTRVVFAKAPRDRVLLETDAPYLAPVPMRSKSNHPAYLVHVNDKIAELWSVTPAESARITTANAMRFYRLEDESVRPDGAATGQPHGHSAGPDHDR